MQLENFHNKHKGENIIVVGCGRSAMDLAKRKDLDQLITIGVNDIDRLMRTNYLLVIDPPKKFSMDRASYVINTKADYVFTQLKEWTIDPPEKKVEFKLGNRKMGNLTIHNVVDYSTTSPFVAAIIAFKLGASRIGMIGVDFTPDHFYANDGEHSLVRSGRLASINKEYAELAEKLKKYGALMYNLSDASRIDAIKKCSIDEFLNRTV